MSARQRWILFGCACLLAILCGCLEEEDDGVTGPGDDNDPPPSGVPIEVNLTAGSYWEYAWTSEAETYAQGSAPSYSVTTNGFKVVLGSPTQIGGEQAFPVSVTGLTADDITNFAPKWTHLAVSADGSLLGTTGSGTWTRIYDSRQAAWSGGGFFVDIGPDQSVEASSSSFPGVYNQTPAIKVGRKLAEGGCVYYESIGETICSGDEMSISEYEYFKKGIGPLGYVFESTVTYSGGGFYSMHKHKRTVELVATSFTPADGSVFHRPAWERAANLRVPRKAHSAVALDGMIYVLGGRDAAGATADVEVYDPGSDSWSPGVPLPTAMWGHTAEVVDGRIYVVHHSGTYSFDPQAGVWTREADTPFNDPSYASAVIEGLPLLFIITPGGAWSGYLQVRIYVIAEKRWAYGWSVSRDDHRWSAVTGVDGFIYVVGGYMQYSDKKVWAGTMRYTVDGGAWEPYVATLNVPRYDAVCVNLDGAVIVLGGRDVVRQLRDAEEYLPSRGSWRKIHSLLKPRTEFDAVVLNGKIYAIGGDSGGALLGDVDIYTTPE